VAMNLHMVLIPPIHQTDLINLQKVDSLVTAA